MKYIIINPVLVTKTQLKLAGVEELGQLRFNTSGDKVVLKVCDSKLESFKEFTKFSESEIAEEMQKSEWTGISWWQNLFG
jgi:hypothetical protein